MNESANFRDSNEHHLSRLLEQLSGNGVNICKLGLPKSVARHFACLLSVHMTKESLR